MVMSVARKRTMEDNSSIILEQQRHLGEQAAVVAALQGTIATLEGTIASLQGKLASQKEVIEKLQRMLFGKKSEKVVFDPSELLPGMQAYFGEEQARKEEEQAGKEEEPKVKIGEHERGKRGQKNAGWNGFPEDLEREERIIDLPEEERRGLKFIGYETSERLVHRKAFVVQVVKRAKYAEEDAPEFGVVTAPAPLVPSCLAANSDRCHYDVSVVAHVIAEKLVDHIPFYRQSEMFARLGIEFGRSAMCAYFAKVSAALEPLYRVLAAEVMACEILHADETRVQMLKPKAGRTKTCWIWVRKTGLGPPLTVFHFSQDRSKGTASQLLGNYEGTIISDRYAAYGALPAESAGCWAHCRRHFFDARTNHPEYASRALDLVRLLYRNEKCAKDAALEKTSETALFKQRRHFRTLSAPVVKQYFDLCREILGKEPPSSAIANAAAYSIRQEEELSRFLSNPKLNIDNNPCENVIRPFCIGRKNWLFVGNDNGGTSMATLASFAATCKDNDVDFEAWLCDVLLRLDTTPYDRITELLPHAWKKSKQNS